MYVPNYIPDPIEVPRNVTEQPYRVRLVFIRRVAVLHFVSLLVVGGLSMILQAAIPFAWSALALGVVVLLLLIIRIATRATKMDPILSLSLFPVLIVFLAQAVRAASALNWPVWGLVVGAGCATVYALLCGRDFSFVGQFFLSLVVSSIALAASAVVMAMDTHQAAILLGINAVYLFYLVYDSASLLARRRMGEEAAAVVDLYRDVFNVFGYLIRVARHWRKHRIWAR